MKITDGIVTIDLEMCIRDTDEGDCTPDISAAFFRADLLEFDRWEKAFKVDNVGACLMRAEDWKTCRGEFKNDILPEHTERWLTVDM